MTETDNSTKLKTFRSFDGTESCDADFHQPDRYHALRSVFAQDGPVVARGAGLSYCLASAATGASVVSTAAFDRILEVDQGGVDQSGAVVTVEAGLGIGRLLSFLLAQGLDFPVLPGHPDITVGGCVAFNVHGKSQHDVGSFGDRVEWFTLYHPDHGEIRVSRSEHPQLFDLTVGGFGLTGLIERVALRVEPLRGHRVRRTVHRAANLADAVDIMEARSNEGGRLYSWNDFLRSGARFGAGVVYEDQPIADGSEPPEIPAPPHTGGTTSEGWRPPVSPYNRVTWSVVNRALGIVESRQRKGSLSAYEAAFPLSGRGAYFTLHGARGFREYQLIVPRPAIADVSTRLQRLLDHTGACVSLASLKLFRGATRNLWFRGDGVCITVDGSATDATRALFGGLDDVAISLGAPVNVAKDSRLSATTVGAIFPEYEEFRWQLREFDPAARCSSALRERLDV